jgi:wobble nucleotide-excising tRNase
METNSGRAILAKNPDHPGSLGIAISEAVEVAATHDDTKYALGSVLNHVLMHQTIIGQEAMLQLEMAGDDATSIASDVLDDTSAKRTKSELTMLTGIQTLKTFGIFDEYTRPTGMKDFCDRNVIYGWNYSGKTTLSRLFHALNEKAPHPDMVGCNFSLTDQDGGTITEENLAASTKTVRVFNSDFVSESLNWNGRAFSPILLLGIEARDATEKIEHYEDVIKRCSGRAAAHRRAMQVIDDRLSEGKTAAAKHIKTTLDIVEAFTAVHLNQLLTVIGIDDTDYILTQEQIVNDLSLATSSEKDRLPAVAAIQFASTAPSVHGTASALFKQRPASSKVIEALREHPHVSEWVSEGLTLHKDKETCEFCLNPLTAERRTDLHAHFSKEVIEQRQSLETLLEHIKLLPFKGVDLRESDLNPQFRPRLKPLLDKIQYAMTPYHAWIKAMDASTREKLREQFSEVAPPQDPQPLVTSLTDAVNVINTLIDESSNNFSMAKTAAIRRLKLHFAQQFTIDFKTNQVAEARGERAREAKRYEAAMAAATTRMKEQQARINRAQNGREKINERIVNLLNSEAIQIEVVPEEGVDRFILKRNGRIAKHLSEGEKTAIAFAFFLTKLLEEPELSNVIVYIDDPISSLDSNHIFQVFSILKSTFFKKMPNTKIPVTTCRQLFISTHNFEFFSLLRDLPGELNYFLTKRISSTRATFVNLPESISRYSSEYHYLFHILYDYDKSANKADVEHLLALPNAARRFLELYTYAKLPLGRKVSVERRAERLFGAEKTSRILKVLHHFSHLESIERLMANTNAVSDIDGAVTVLMECLKADKEHYDALVEAVT